MSLSPGTKRDLETIMDCFTGVDGGLAYLNLKSLLGGVTAQQEKLGGDAAANKILAIVHQFAMMIETANVIASERPKL